MPEVYKQYSIFLEACMGNDERAEFIKDESLNNIKNIFDDKKLNEALDDYKKEFDTALNDIDIALVKAVKAAEAATGSDIRQAIAEADRQAYEAYTTFLDNIKTFISLYIKAVKVT